MGNGKQAALQCGVNLSDYSDFSDSDSESEPKTPLATMVMQKDLPKSISATSVAVDDATSTDAASSTLSDAASTANVSDESDVDSDSCPSPKASKCVYARDTLMLFRIAVGMRTDAPAQWSTKPIKDSLKAPGDGSEWRRGAAAQQ